MHVSPQEKERKMLKKKGSRNTMTLKYFHDGSIPTDLPLPSTHGGSIPTQREREEREREREREVFATRVGRGVFRSFGLVPLKQKSHGRHVIVLSA